ncbi:hypothetical protein FRUB_02669 [Fimbriiglobus ruber]|uniref:Type II/III secretion system secretin-like domain-containing protein n=2 Tax=Fimbriiglobus ruber TaxID=1908690 RepID=A0A225DNL4_9BACT|nr:hypothetical protein FRUB_02669 [Fimbriiglobus ruber]
MKLVRGTIRPYAWNELGGPGTVRFDAEKGELVVTQTAEVQAEVADLIASLRNKLRTQIMVELTVIECAEPSCERIGVDFIGNAPAGAAGSIRTVTELTPIAKLIREANSGGAVDSARLTQLLAAAKADGNIDILYRPQMLLTEGVVSRFEISQEHKFLTGLDVSMGNDGVVQKPRYEAVREGIRINLTPTLSTDKKTIALTLDYETARLDKMDPVAPVAVSGDPATGEQPPLLLQKPRVQRAATQVEVTVRPGVTAVVVGPKVTRETRTEFALPVVSKIPYLNRLFRNVAIGRTEAQQLILVTAQLQSTDGEPACPEAKVCPQEAKATTEATRLVGEYRKACAAGRSEEALKFAMQALACDPKCFADGR